MRYFGELEIDRTTHPNQKRRLKISRVDRNPIAELGVDSLENVKFAPFTVNARRNRGEPAS
jgi:hypothetical protein